MKSTLLHLTMLGIVALVLTACGPSKVVIGTQGSGDESGQSGDSQGESGDFDDESEKAEPLKLQSVKVYDGPVRAMSVQVAFRGETVAWGFDTPDGDAFGALGSHTEPFQIAQRAQFGCVAVDASGVTWMGTVERDASAPVSRLVVRRYNSDGESLDDGWSPSNPPLWPEPGSKCAFVEDSGSIAGVVSRSREARSDAVVDLWYSPTKGAGKRFEVGTHVPRIIQSQPVPGGALISLDHVERNEDGNRIHTWSLWSVGSDGDLFRHGVDPDRPIGLGTEERTVVVANVDKGSRPPGGAVSKPHATMRASVAPLAAANEYKEGLGFRVDVFEPVSPAIAPRLFFRHGQWWAILQPEPYVLRGQKDPAPYRERIAALQEGRTVVRELPEDVYLVQVAGSGDAALWLAVGAPVEDRKGVADGVIRLEGELDVLDL